MFLSLGFLEIHGLRGFLFVYKRMYIKIVVIVNDENSVDKSLFFHRIMDLAEK
jgi:hypothetical protein